MSQSNIYSHLTAKERDRISFPARMLFEKGMLKGEILDFGCGFGKDVEILKKGNLDVSGYDKHYFPNYPEKKFDTIICFYVLNVLLPEEQSKVLMEVSSLLKPNGKAYFAVRRDLVYVGYRTHKIHQKPTFQCNVILPYKSFFKNENCEIYEYTPINNQKPFVINECPFCSLGNEIELITESATAFAVFDKFPISKGHALIIIKRHCSNYFDLTFKEESACIFMLNFVKEVIQKKYEPNGYNVGINVEKSAGQTVDHVHIHLIPRYDGDVEDPTGGIRNIFPLLGNYLV
ncbi:HIT domain-containing protein [Belliella sp. R4-6]|uniref:HIT domain-containing protein n=1 Tax=Belliella alkalica TaxID=1730871 RepID=A0ABS9VDQ4_9BACT|nr:HIT domain-containing protein [Belliella alkalica]MCH7414566.1 HIT domain-containing protein [Belliella alkalica]